MVITMELPPSDRIEAGIDEAGRGSLYGAVFAAACIMPPDETACDPRFVRDSKRFSSRKTRAAAAEHIKAYALDWAVASASPQEIDVANIQQATFLAMHRAVDALQIHPGSLAVDGDRFKQYIRMTGDDDYSTIPHKTIVKGDAVHASIAAASVLAKVAHDDYITSECSSDPALDGRYGLLQNMGYGTAAHIRGIRTFGLHPHHRKSFRISQKEPEDHNQQTHKAR